MDHERFVPKRPKTKRFIVVSLLLLATICVTFGQSYYVHRPDARVMNHGSYGVGLHLAPGGGLLLGLSVGFFDRLQIGLSYGGGNIIGSGPIEWYPLPPGVEVKVVILDEYSFPLSLAIGFDSQEPVGSNLPESSKVNPAGIYLVAGKLIPVGWVAFDLALGAGYDLVAENAFHLYAVSGLIIGEAFSITPELTVYPQRDEDIVNLGLSFKWEIYEGTGAEFLLADILNGPATGWTRSVRFQITQEF
jgi:hypothetical protein